MLLLIYTKKLIYFRPCFLIFSITFPHSNKVNVRRPLNGQRDDMCLYCELLFSVYFMYVCVQEMIGASLKTCMLHYATYRNTYPLWALAKYRKAAFKTHERSLALPLYYID